MSRFQAARIETLSHTNHCKLELKRISIDDTHVYWPFHGSPLVLWVPVAATAEGGLVVSRH